MKNKSKGNSLRKDIKILFKTLKLINSIDKTYLLLIIINSVLNSARYFISLIMSAKILDELLNQKNIQTLTLYVGVIIGANFILKLIADYTFRIRVGRNLFVRNKIHSKVAEKILTVDFEYIDNPVLHNLRQRFLEYDTMSGTIGRLVPQLRLIISGIVDVAASAAISVALFKPALNLASDIFTQIVNSPYMALVMLLMIGAVILIQVRLSTKSGKYQNEMNEKSLEVNRIGIYVQFDLVGNYINGKDLRMYDSEKLISNFTNRFVLGIRASLLELFSKLTKLQNVNAIASGIFTAFIYLLVVFKAFIGAITVGSIMKFAGAIQKFSSGITNLLSGAVMIRVDCQFFDYIHQLLELPNIKYHGTLPVEKREDNDYEIEFKNVSFKYPNSEEYVLKNVSIKLTIGERLAVVGMNGAGKTTFIKLLARLYDPTEGEILLNGIDIKKYDYEQYMSLFSVVFQDFQLFSFEIGQDLASSTEVDEQKAVDCLSKAGLEERMKKLPKKTNTVLQRYFDEEGVDFSGGELQKIAIARALYKDAPIIILDEPTASLDPMSEFEIYSKFDNLVGNKTAIYISHRLSSCRFCHDIAVFSEGEIIQRGSHDILVADKGGKYFELWNAQAQYYNDEKE